MNYFHGSGQLFSQFDREKSKDIIKCVHLTPHKEYALSFAISNRIDNNPGYVYEVEVEGDNSNYSETGQTIRFADLTRLKIISVTFHYGDNI